jgi:AcrR family transcriptional regulator
MKVTKEQVLRKALVFFASHDYDRASLNEIAHALNITKGGIYHYFSSKDELFREVVVFVLDKMESQMMDSMDMGVPLKEILILFFRLDDVAGIYSQVIGLDIMGEYFNLVYLLFSSMKKFPDVKVKMERVYTRFMTAMEMLFREGQKRGEIRKDLNPQGLAFELTAFIEGGMLVSAVCSGLDGNRSGELVLENFWRCISPSEIKLE